MEKAEDWGAEEEERRYVQRGLIKNLAGVKMGCRKKEPAPY